MRMIFHRPARYARSALALLFVLCAWPSAAGAVGEEQADRVFVSAGVGPLFPLNDAFQDAYDASFGFHIEGGFIKSLGGGLAVAPVAAFRFWDLNLDEDFAGAFDTEVTTAIQFLLGAQFGYAKSGLFAYGEAGFGINAMNYELCIGVFCAEGDETDVMFRIGGGVDFSLWTYLAVGGKLAGSIVFSDDTDAVDGNQTAFEFLGYVKFLVPAGPITK